jgi:hypothetical protein
MRGDIAAWSYCFDKVNLLESRGPNRLKGLAIARVFHRECERYGWHNRRLLSASNIQPALHLLETMDFVIQKRIVQPCVVEYSLGDWFRAGDIKTGLNRAFSVFPPDLSAESRQELCTRIAIEEARLGIDEEQAIDGRQSLHVWVLYKDAALAESAAFKRQRRDSCERVARNCASQERRATSTTSG